MKKGNLARLFYRMCFLPTPGKRFSVLQKIIALASLVALVIIAWPARFYFLNDDLIHIPLSAAGMLGHNKSVRYTGDLSLMLDNLFYGRNAIGYHITNLLLHLINCFLFFAALSHYFKNENRIRQSWILLYAVLLFAFFGFHSDAIFWIIGRSASLGCFFLLLTIICMQNWEMHVAFRIGFMVSWLFALFAYESVWIFPFIAFLTFFLFQKPSLSSFVPSGVQVILLWLCLIGYLFIRKWVTGSFLGTYEAAAYETFSTQTLLVNYGKLILRTLIPPMQNGLYFLLAGCAAGLVYLGILFYLFQKKLITPIWIFIHICWIISYLPYLSLGISSKTIESERFLYLPSIFFSLSIMVTLFISFAKNKPVLFHVLCTVIITIHAVFFIKTANDYAEAGKTVSKTFMLLKQQQPILYLEVNNLPQTIHGIPVFRSGFSEGYRWILNNQTVINVQDSMQFNEPIIVPTLLQKGDKHYLNFLEN